MHLINLNFSMADIQDQLESIGWELVPHPILQPSTRLVQDDLFINIPRHASMADYMTLMWPDHVMEHIIQSTNADEVASSQGVLTLNELRRYFRQLCIIGVFHLSEVIDLWRTTDYVFTYPNKSAGLGIH